MLYTFVLFAFLNQSFWNSFSNKWEVICFGKIISNFLFFPAFQLFIENLNLNYFMVWPGFAISFHNSICINMIFDWFEISGIKKYKKSFFIKYRTSFLLLLTETVSSHDICQLFIVAFVCLGLVLPCLWNSQTDWLNSLAFDDWLHNWLNSFWFIRAASLHRFTKTPIRDYSEKKIWKS